MRISIGTLALNICIAPNLGKYRATLVFSSSSTIIVNSIQALKVVWSLGHVLPLPVEAFSGLSTFLVRLTLGLEINWS